MTTSSLSSRRNSTSTTRHRNPSRRAWSRLSMHSPEPQIRTMPWASCNSLLGPCDLLRSASVCRSIRTRPARPTLLHKHAAANTDGSTIIHCTHILVLELHALGLWLMCPSMRPMVCHCNVAALYSFLTWQLTCWTRP